MKFLVFCTILLAACTRNLHASQSSSVAESNGGDESNATSSNARDNLHSPPSFVEEQAARTANDNEQIPQSSQEAIKRLIMFENILGLQEWFSMKPSDVFDEAMQKTHLATIREAKEEIDKKIKQLVDYNEKLFDSIREIVENPTNAVKPFGLLKTFFQVPDYLRPEDGKQAQKQGPKSNFSVEALAEGHLNDTSNNALFWSTSPADLFKVNLKIIQDFSAYLPSISEVFVYLQLLVKKVEMSNQISEMLEDFPEETKKGHADHIKKLLNIRDFSIEQRELINGMLEDTLANLKHWKKRQIQQLKETVTKSASKIHAAMIALKTKTNNSDFEAPAKLLMEEAAKISSYSSIKQCIELREKFLAFEGEIFPIVDEIMKNIDKKTGKTQEQTPQSNDNEVKDDVFIFKLPSNKNKRSALNNEHSSESGSEDEDAVAYVMKLRDAEQKYLVQRDTSNNQEGMESRQVSSPYSQRIWSRNFQSASHDGTQNVFNTNNSINPLDAFSGAKKEPPMTSLENAFNQQHFGKPSEWHNAAQNVPSINQHIGQQAPLQNEAQIQNTEKTSSETDESRL